MPDLDLDAIAEAHRPKGHYNCPACDANVHPCVVNALIAEVRRLRAIEAAAREVAAVDGHWGQTAAQMAEDMDWQGREAQIPVEVSRAAFVALLRALGASPVASHG